MSLMTDGRKSAVKFAFHGFPLSSSCALSKSLWSLTCSNQSVNQSKSLWSLTHCGKPIASTDRCGARSRSLCGSRDFDLTTPGILHSIAAAARVTTCACFHELASRIRYALTCLSLSPLIQTGQASWQSKKAEGQSSWLRAVPGERTKGLQASRRKHHGQ